MCVFPAALNSSALFNTPEMQTRFDFPSVSLPDCRASSVSPSRASVLRLRSNTASATCTQCSPVESQCKTGTLPLLTVNEPVSLLTAREWLRPHAGGRQPTLTGAVPYRTRALAFHACVFETLASRSPRTLAAAARARGACVAAKRKQGSGATLAMLTCFAVYGMYWSQRDPSWLQRASTIR